MGIANMHVLCQLSLPVCNKKVKEGIIFREVKGCVTAVVIGIVHLVELTMGKYMIVSTGIIVVLLSRRTERTSLCL